MYAIMRSGGHQYRVSEGVTIEVERLEVAEGDTISFDEVLLVSGDEGVKVGQPLVGGASVQATVLGEMKGDKIKVMKYKRKKRYRVRTGHRQRYTRLQIDKIKA